MNQASQDMSDFANIDRMSTTTNVFEIIAQHMVRIAGEKELNLGVGVISDQHESGQNRELHERRSDAFDADAKSS